MTEVEGCKNCGQPAEAIGYKLPLCVSCRDQFARRPLPPWITGASILLAVVVLLALARFPPALRAGIAFERGQRAEASGSFAPAVDEYRKVVDTYPDSTQALGRLAVTAYRARRGPDVVFALRKLSGRRIPSELAQELEPIVNQMGGHMRERRGE